MPELASRTPVASLLVTRLRPDGDRVVVTVRGELDLDTSEQFREVLREALNRSVHGIRLDLEAVSFCDCSALNILLTVRDLALAQAKSVSLHSTSTAVERLLNLTGARTLFANESEGTDSEGTGSEATGSEVTDGDLRIELAQLRRAMQTRPTIDLARGILMASFGLSTEEAWKVLVAASQNTNTKLHSLAGEVVTAIKGDPLPESVQEQLSSAVSRVTSS
ncbi:anti-sigma factor antagonist [Streptomyces sp. HD]|uniref:anti-sigma factor antagonist n=1 Tax=Streptomyces sp. HD TaxID=3020892 RepID=UPI00232FA9BB|nr:anti-sigma factor antagonist [Streptomyces sp. HD]MDC0773174.1 anti-sigma factor antagonist [Streptomyces sp. HD]